MLDGMSNEAYLRLVGQKSKLNDF